MLKWACQANGLLGAYVGAHTAAYAGFGSFRKALAVKSCGKSTGSEIARHLNGQISTHIPHELQIERITTGLGQSAFFTLTHSALC